jgi:hypothetical protein
VVALSQARDALQQERRQLQEQQEGRPVLLPSDRPRFRHTDPPPPPPGLEHRFFSVGRRGPWEGGGGLVTSRGRAWSGWTRGLVGGDGRSSSGMGTASL